MIFSIKIWFAHTFLLLWLYLSSVTNFYSMTLTATKETYPNSKKHSTRSKRKPTVEELYPNVTPVPTPLQPFSQIIIDDTLLNTPDILMKLYDWLELSLRSLKTVEILAQDPMINFAISLLLMLEAGSANHKVETFTLYSVRDRKPRSCIKIIIECASRNKKL